MNWDDLRIFLSIAEAPSMRHAAKQLKVSHTTVSRRVDSLEESLGVRLFDRLTTGYELTKSGRELRSIALQTDDRINDFNRMVKGRDGALAGQLRVTIPDTSMGKLFIPLFVEFMQTNPDIQIKVSDSLAVVNLSNLEADIAIRMTNSPPDHLIGRCLGKAHQAVYATQQYIDEHQPHKPDSNARWIGYGTEDGEPKWIAHSMYPHLKSLGIFNNVMLQLDIVLDSAGIAFFPCHIGDKHKSLVRLCDPKPSYDVWMLSHRDLRATARMRAFRHFIAERIPDIKARLEGCAVKL